MKRLAIGPANYASQATAWAQAVKDNLDVDAWSFQRGPVRRGGFQFDADVTIPAPLFHTSAARRLRSRRLFRDTTHIALDGYQPYFRLFRKNVFGRDARWLERQGFSMALIAHGTDVRDPAAHQEREGQWSYFNEGTPEWRAHLRDFTARNRGYARDLGMPLFVSTPDLLFDLPDATWLPVCVDADDWASQELPLQRRQLRVLHLPSKKNPPIKGTQYVDPVLRRLHEEGIIEYVSPASTPHAQMRGLVQSCDVVVDQILFGSYGVAAVEAMAAGRLTIGRVSSEVRSLVPHPLPIVDANALTLETLVREIAADPAAWADQAAAGVPFVRAMHDGRASADAMAAWLRQ